MREPLLAIVISVTAASCGATPPKPVEPPQSIRGPTVHGYLEAIYDPEAAGTTFGGESVVIRRSSGQHDHHPSQHPARRLCLDRHSYEPMQLELDTLRVESFQAKRPKRADIPATLISGNLPRPRPDQPGWVAAGAPGCVAGGGLTGTAAVALTFTLRTSRTGRHVCLPHTQKRTATRN